MTDEELRNFMSEPSIFIPGFQVQSILNVVKSPRPMRIMMTDITDLLFDVNAPKEYACDIVLYLAENYAVLDDVKIANYVFQLDCIMDFLFFTKKKGDALLQMKTDRQEIVAKIKSAFPQRRLLQDLIANFPSLRVENFINNGVSSKSSISPMTCLHYVEYASTLISVDPFEAIYLKDALLALLSSRLEDPLMEEHDKQRWITQFADSSVWMSTARVASCISAMIRAKRYDELVALQYNFSLAKWKKVSDFMSPDELDTIPVPLKILITGQNIEEFRVVLDIMSKSFLDHYVGPISIMVKLYTDGKSSKTTAVNGLQRALASFDSISDAFTKPERVLEFCIACALLVRKPEIESNGFKSKFASIMKLGKLEGPVKEIYSSGASLKHANFEFGIMSGDTEVRCEGPEEAFFCLIISILRNFRSVLGAFLDLTQRSQMTSLAKPEVMLKLANPSQTELFLDLSELICKYDLSKNILLKDLEKMRFNETLCSPRLSLPMKTILFEGVIGMHICQLHFHSVKMCSWEVGVDESLSHTVGALRWVKAKADLSTFSKLLNVIRICYSNRPERFSAAYAMFMWAILPRIMDDDAGADEVIEALQANANLQTNGQFHIIRRTAFRMMLEYTSVDHLFSVIPKLADCGMQVEKLAVGCTLSPRRRKALLIALCYHLSLLEISARLPTPTYNLFLLLSVKQNVPENSIEYMTRFFTGYVPLDSISLAHAIVEGIMMVGMGKKKDIKFLSDEFAISIFLGTNHPIHRVFFDGVKYELAKSLHLHLLPDDLKYYFISLFCIPNNNEKSQRLKFGLIQHRYLETVSIEAKSPPIAVEKKQESKLGAELKPEPRKHPKSKPRPNQLAQLVRKNEKTSESKLLAAKQVLSPVRPPRSRPTANGKSSKHTLGIHGQQNQQEDKTKPQRTTFSDNSVSARRKEKVQADIPQLQPKETTVKEDIANSIQSENDSLIAPVNSQLSGKQGEAKMDSKPFKPTIESLRTNAFFLTNGHISPKNVPSNEFIKYIEEEVSHGFLPFKLDKEFLSYLTKGRNKDQFTNKTWNPIRGWREREVWRPKLYTPIRIFVRGVTLGQIADLRSYVFQLTREQVARLQSLCYYSNLAPKNPDKFLNRAISKRTLKFVISSGLKVYQVSHGWIQMSSFPKAFKEFSSEVATLTESPVTDNIVSSVITNYARTAKIKEKFQKAYPIKPNNDVEVEKEESEDDFKTKQQETTDDHINNAAHATLLLTACKSTDNAHLNDSSLLGNSSNQHCTTDVFLDNSSSAVQLKVTSPVFIPKKSEKNEHSEGHLHVLENFTQVRQMVTLSNYLQKLLEFHQLLKSGVEYVALDCEMTGLYTVADEEVHRKDKSSVRVDNTEKLMKAVEQNLMFQLGLTVKTKEGKFSVWSFYTAPSLTVHSFTPDTFNFFFNKNKSLTEVELGQIHATVTSIAMSSVSVDHFLAPLFSLKTPLVLFSGYVDLMHVRKAANQPYVGKHEDFQKHLDNDFCDVKQITLEIMDRPLSLELLMKELYPGLEMSKKHLHDASFDSLLTALAFDKLKGKYGVDRMTKRLLFNFENEYSKTNNL